MIKFSRGFVTVALLGGIVCGVASSAYAGELRILDSHGLVRATTDAKSESTVELKLAAPVKEGTVQLSNVNGLAPDIAGEIIAGMTVRFSVVPEGIWRVIVPGPAITITKVEIK